jgi:hypothetical protein
MAQQQLDLLKLTAGCAAQFRASATKIVRCNSGDADGHKKPLKTGNRQVVGRARLLAVRYDERRSSGGGVSLL